MQPFLITLTGADDSTDPAEMAELSAQFPFVEWAILFSPNHEGDGRIPSRAWRHQLTKEFPQLRLSAHLCGRAVKDFAFSDAQLLTELQSYSRIQLNFNSKRLARIIQIALVATAECLAIERPELNIITQHHGSNEEVWSAFAHLPTAQVLFDASGGNGVSPETWCAPLPGRVCGYSGGIGPDNIDDELTSIALCAGAAPFWLDMEGKLRTDDKFDLAKCRQVLEVVSGRHKMA